MKLRANVKAAIFVPKDYIRHSDLSQYVSYEVSVPENIDMLDYITTVAEIINRCLKISVDVNVVFRIDNVYKEGKLPLVFNIPLYILRFYADIIINNPKNTSQYKITDINNWTRLNLNNFFYLKLYSISHMHYMK